MSQAARINDPIGHSPGMSWLVNGAMAGAAIGLGAITIVGTGGLAATAIVGGLVAGGAGIGEMFSTMSWAPKEVCGVIKGPCSGNVFTNGIPAARAHVDVVDCSRHAPPYPPIATGSATVFINGQPAARVNDKAGCSAVISSGSHNVFIGGGTVQTDMLEPETLVPDGVHAVLLVAGVGSAIALGGPIIATAGLIGGMAGELGGKWLGGHAFGIGSDGQKWAMLGGSLLGGVAGTKGAASLAGKGIVQPLVAEQEALKGKPYEAIRGERADAADEAGSVLTSEPKGTIFSGHGSYEVGSGATVIPEGTSVTVYSKFGATITNRLGNVIETGGDLSNVYSRTYGPGESLPNYTLYAPDGLMLKGSPVTVSSPTRLSTLLKPNMGNCQWAACTYNWRASNANTVFDTVGIVNKKTKQWITIYSKD